jgi:hypothetical protein
MKVQRHLTERRSSMLALASAALPAAAQYVFNATDVAAFGAAPYGTVTLTQDGSNVDFRVDLRGDLKLSHHRRTQRVRVQRLGGRPGRHRQTLTTPSASAATFKAIVPGIDPPFGSFNFGIVCDTGCSPGGLRRRLSRSR